MFITAGINKILNIIANREDPDLRSGSALFVDLGFFNRQLVFKILELLPYIRVLELCIENTPCIMKFAFITFLLLV